MFSTVPPLLPSFHKGGLKVDVAESFRCSKVDFAFVSITFVLCFLYFHAGIHQAVGNQIVLFLAFFSMLNPFSAVIYLAASQTMIDPPGLPYTPAQLSVLGFSLSLLVPGRIAAFIRGIPSCLKYILPFFLISIIKRVVVWNAPPFQVPELIMWLTPLMVVAYTKGGVPRMHFWLFCLALGGIVAIGGWFFHTAGMEATVEATGGIRDRLYIGRARNATNIGLVSGLGGILSIWLFCQVRSLAGEGRSLKQPVSVVMLVLAAMAVMTVFAARSRGGFVSMLLVAGLAVGLAMHASSPSARQRLARLLVKVVILPGLVGLVLYWVPATGIQASIENMRRYSEFQAEQHDTNVLVAGRYTAWVPAVHDLGKTAVFGKMPGDVLETDQAHDGVHNVFLGTWLHCGIIGLVAFLFYFAMPTYNIRKQLGLYQAWPFLVVLFSMFLGFCNLGFMNYKTFHVFNGMMIASGLRLKPHRPECNREGF